MANVLIIEDDEDIREGLRIFLEGEAYTVYEAPNGIDGLKILSEDTDLVILDVMMPGISGIKTCEEIRKVSNVPVLFLTAKSQESDKLVGLTVGGDDYLSKPFSYTELLGRVKALLRRYKVYKGKGSSGSQNDDESNSEHEYLEAAGIKISRNFNEAYVNNKEVILTDLEYKILILLMKYPGKVFSAQNIYESVWEEPYFYNCNGTIMVHIRKLRTKVEKDPKNPKHVVTLWGKGYRFEDR